MIPTAYNKNIIETEIKNQIFQKYKINVKFNSKVYYSLFPKPNFSSKNLSILNEENEIAIVENFKIFISFKNFFKLNKITTNDLILDKTDFNIKKSDLSFFSKLMKIEPSRNKIIIKRSNIFFRDKDDEVLFINQIINSSFYYDFKNLKNLFNSKNKIFNIPYKLIIKNDKLNQELETIMVSNKLVLKIENKTDYSNENNEGALKIAFKNKNNLFNYKLKKNSLNYELKDTNKSYQGLMEFKPFYLVSNLNYQTLRLKDLLNNSLLIQIFKSQIFNNENLNANINFFVKNIYDFDRFNNLSLKLKIEEGNMTFSDSQIMWRDNINLSLSEGLLIFEDEKIDFNGSVIVNIKDDDNFYKTFQINKEYRNDIKKIEFDFNYSFNENQIYFDNLKIDDKSNKELDKFISNYNSDDKKFFNKITFKTFVNKIFVVYFG